jgi:hypothetical protein
LKTAAEILIIDITRITPNSKQELDVFHEIESEECYNFLPKSLSYLLSAIFV